MQAIDQALAAARLGKSSRLVIRGEPGIGKTALLEHAVAQAGSMKLLAARGVEFEADVPFAGLHQLLAPALGLMSRLPKVHASALRSSLGLGARIEADRLIVGVAVLEIISAYAERDPLLITVDDVQWMDRASSEAIAFAARRLVADAVCVLVAIRSDEESPFLASGMTEVNLAGLDRASATELIRRTASAELTRENVDGMVDATGGNPLALLELAPVSPRYSASPLQELPIVTSVERSYLRRADGLADGARHVLLLMSASGTAERALVRRAAAALEIAPDDVERAEEAERLVRVIADRVEFVHPLARAAIYHSASAPQRRAAHRALAAVMTDADSLDRRAWHLAAAASGWDDEAAQALEAAARRARESSAYDAAAGALAEAARLTEEPELRGLRTYRAADNAWLAGQAARAVALLAAARKLSTSIAVRVDIDNLDGHIAMRRGAVMEGYRMMAAAADAVESTDRLKAIRILADATLSSYGAGFPTAMLAGARKALDMLKSGDPAESAVFAHVAYGTLAIMAGRGSDGPKQLHESVALFRAVPSESVDPLVLTCAGLAGLFLREAEVGRELLDRALKQARDHAPTAALPSVLFMLGRDAAATDQWPLARAQYEEGSRLARETIQLTWLAGMVSGLAWLDALEGREDECRAHAAEGRELSERYSMGLFKAWSQIALGQLELGLGRPEPALGHFQECSDFLQSVSIDDPDLSPAPDIVDALVRLGRLEDARQTSDVYAKSARAKGQPFALARAARARALLAGDAEYTREYESALRHHEGTPDVFERARTQLYYGERLRRSRRRVDARRHLREALKAFDLLGASPWSERALAELQASGETARVRDDRYRQQLTPQEFQVALTLAEGATTREAAARLYLSPKTIEYHLRHVYDKLEIRTRSELGSALAGQARPQSARQALMFTDLAGSTSLVEAIGDSAWQTLSAWLDNEMRRLFKEHKGREVDHAGDGFLVIFASSADAIDCAVSIQRRLSSQRRLHGYAPQMRIGVHIGEVSGAEPAVRGAAVHQAARLSAAAKPDTILVSRQALEAAHRSTSGLRELTLKGIKGVVEAAEVGWAD